MSNPISLDPVNFQEAVDAAEFHVKRALKCLRDQVEFRDADDTPFLEEAVESARVQLQHTLQLLRDHVEHGEGNSAAYLEAARRFAALLKDGSGEAHMIIRDIGLGGKKKLS